MSQNFKSLLGLIKRKWYLYLPLLLFKLVFDFAEDLLFSTIREMSQGLVLIEFLKNNGWLLSWIAIPSIIIGLLLRDYITERKIHKAHLNTEDLSNGYYYLVLTLDPNPHNDAGLYRWYRLERRDGSFLDFKREPDSIRTALDETGIFCVANMDRGARDTIYEIWFIRNPNTLLLWFIKRLEKEDISLRCTKSKEPIRIIEDIKRLWNEAQIKSDIRDGFDMTQFKLLEIYLSAQQKGPSKYSTLAEAVQSFEDYHNALCDLCIRPASSKDERVSKAKNLDDKCMKFYRAFQKELGLGYKIEELAWYLHRVDSDALINRIRKIIEGFKELRDKEELNPNH